jgi:hypothetical protein
VTLLSSGPLLPLLGSPLGFAGAGVVGAIPTFVFLVGRIGAAKAVMLAAVVGVALALVFMALAYGAWLLTG